MNNHPNEASSSSQINVIAQRARFNRRSQHKDESINTFITDLYALSEHCGYGKMREEMIRDRIVVGVRDQALSEKLQAIPDLTLDVCINALLCGDEKFNHNNSHECTTPELLSEEEGDASFSDGPDDVMVFCEEEDHSMNAMLEQDIQSVRIVFGDDAVELRIMNCIDLVDVDLKVDVSFLAEELANAWKVNRHEPVVIRLTLSLSHYLESNEPDVKVYQHSFKEKFRLARQIQQIVEKYISKEWRDHKQVNDKSKNSTTGSVEDIQNGFLQKVMHHVGHRIPTLNEYCVICDEAHVFQNGHMLKPSVCSRELCVFAFQQLGVMSDVVEDIATGAEVVNLLIVMARAACSSKRKLTIFDPYPTVVSPSSPKLFAFTPKNKDFNRIEQALSHLTNFRQMASMDVANMKSQLDAQDSLAFPLLQWIISSNRSHIVKLSKTKQLAFMRTSHQFLLLSSSPSKELAFHAAKNTYGSVFAFHGSGIENWHSILRNGLVNASGTSKMVHGAKYGDGIYLSPMLNVSSMYSNMGKSVTYIGGSNLPESERFLRGNQFTCIALCEVVNSPRLKKCGNIWVCPETDHVCTRFFFVYEDGAVGEYLADTREEKIHRDILNAMAN